MQKLRAWHASFCQPHVTFRLSQAAQFQESGNEEIKDLNIALQAQQNDPDAGLRYVNLNLDEDLVLYGYFDISIVNKKDFTPQIGFMITLGNKMCGDNTLPFRGNLIY